MTVKVPPQVDELDIAVVGMAGRFPGARNLHEYWSNLAGGVESISRLSESELLAAGVDPKLIADPAFVPAAALLDDVEMFDAGFFGYSPREARLMDPQARLFLECAWEAFETAGYNPRSVPGVVGVYAAQSMNTYLLGHGGGAFDTSGFTLSAANFPAVLGNNSDFLTTRVSYKFNLNGPSVNVQSACSSSLVAVHLARQALVGGECDMALAGAVSIYLPQKTGYLLTDGMILSPDGHCRPFDAQARGTLFGRGVGVVLLKSLARAIADGDCIRAVIKGSAINNDGSNRAGFTAPGVDGQARVIAEALANAGVDADTIGYVEAHGTATTQGDPIELAALTQGFRATTARRQFCALGSVKSNIGHLDVAAGMAGLIKTVLMLEHRQLVPTLHYTSPNPQLNIEQSPFFVNTTLGAWTSPDGPRRAGVSSFGMGGTNSHVVLEEAPEIRPEPPAGRSIHVLPLSAKSPAALQALAMRFAEHLAAHPAASLADVCFTAAAGREHFEHRAAIAASSLADAREQLIARAADISVDAVVAERPAKPKMAFLFTGQGSQYAGMARGLYETQAAFRRALDRCDAALRPHLQGSLLSIIYPAQAEADRIDETAFTQPALFAVEYALAEMWRAWGVEPAAVLGHSVGEYVAACVAGVFSLEDALKLVAARGRLMQALPRDGAMAAVLAPEPRVAAIIEPFGPALAIAAVNAPDSVVISGKASAIDEALASLEREGIRAQRLRVSHAFHSALLEPMLDEFERIAAGVRFAAPRLEVISNVTGGRVDGATLGQPAYWRQHARAAVRFAAGVQSLADLGCTAFLEIGPDPILIGLGQRSIDRPGAAWLATLRRGRDDWSQVAASLAALYELGAPIDWAAFDQGFPRQRVVLPTYPFQRERFWLEPQPAIARGPRPAAVEPVHPLLGRRVRSALAAQQFEIELTAGMLPLIDDHRIGGAAILPATGFIEMMLAAGGQSFGPGGKSLEDLTIVEPLPVPRIVQVILTPREDGRADCQICSAPAGESQPEAWRLHATAIIGAAVVPSHAVDVESTRRQCPHELTASAHYETLRQLGNDFGPALQTVRRMWTGERHAIAELAVHADAADSDARFHLHPAMLDGCFQMLVDSPAAKAAAAADEGYLPVGLDRLTVYEPCGPEAIGTLQLRADDAAAARLLVGDVDLVGPAGQLIAVASGVRFARASRQAIRRARQEQLDSVYAIQWRDASDDAVPSGNDRLPRRWLVFADRNGIGAEAARRLEEPGDRVLVVVDAPDEEFSAANGVLRMDARRDDHFAALASLVLADREPAGLVHLWTLDAADPNETGDSGALLHAVETGGGSTLRLMQHLGPAAPVAGIWLVTRGAEFPLQAGRPVSPAHAAVLGFARSLGRERPQVRCATVDLDPAQADHASELVDAVRAGGVEDRFALREGHRYVARLARLDAERQPPPAADEQVQLEVVNRGLLDSLALRPATRRAPGAGEIEVRVAACGMNFRDVLNALGMYEGAPVPLGTECAGVVTAVGAGVSRVKVGDAVAGMAPASFSRFAVGQAGHFVRIPASLTMIEAATIPVAFLTADYALNVLARMKRGDRVLIHAGAGGVGLAAIQLAQQAGAEVFATAGSEEKRRFLRSLGVRHVMSSRSLDFKAQILAATDRRGLDIVLNSLTGDFIAASFDVLANGGRFLEIGKKGIWTEGEASQRRPDARYFTIFLGDVDTPVVSRRFEELMAAFERGTLRPLPATVFPLDQAPRAFRFMAQARHIGKVIVVPDGSIGSGRSREIRADGTYLITGGYGALGLATAKWLASRGARAIALVGRRGPSEQARPSLEALEAQGVRVHCATGDVAQLDDVERIVGELTAALPPLRGIVHAAGVLDDGVVEHQTWSRCAAVVAPKAAGAWNLHRASRTLPLDFFFCFSSIAAAFGSAGQTTYGAANAFLDGFADHRRALGLPALSIAWGPWAEGGMAASMDARNRSRLARTGLELMTTEQATAVLDFALRHDGASLVAARVSWREYLAQFDAAVPPLFADLNKAVDVRAGGRPRPHDGGDLKREIEAAPVKRRRSILLARVRAEAVNVLGLAGSAPLDGSRPLNELGLDSLMAIELRNTLSRAIGRPLPATLLFKAPSVAALADALLEELEGAAAAEPSRKPVAQPTAAVLDDLSDDEVKEGLAAELEALTRKGWAD